MVWFKVDDHLHDHRKIRQVGMEALGLWTAAGSWCADNLTDGFVPVAVLPRWARRWQASAVRLCDVGLWMPWERDGEVGYLFHDWDAYQPTADEVEQDRLARSEAGRVAGLASGRVRRAKANERRTNDERNVPPEVNGQRTGRSTPVRTETNPVPSRPDPTTTEPTVPPGTAQTLIAEWIDRCQARPPSRVIGQVAKHVAELLAEGTDPDHIRQGLDLWQRKGLHPSTLASVVNEAMNSSPYAVVKPKPSTTDAKLAQTLSLLGQYERQELTSG